MLLASEKTPQKNTSLDLALNPFGEAISSLLTPLHFKLTAAVSSRNEI